MLNQIHVGRDFSVAQTIFLRNATLVTQLLDRDDRSVEWATWRPPFSSGRFKYTPVSISSSFS